MLLAKLISQTHMHAIFRLVSQDPRDRIYSKGLDVVDLDKIAPVPGREKYWGEETGREGRDGGL